MMKFKGLQFVHSISTDLTEEFNELDEMITAAENGKDNACEIHSAYQHLGSLIQGLEYMAEFIADDGDREELAEALKDLREERDGFYPRAASVIYTKRLGKPVDVTMARHNNGDMDFLVTIDEQTKIFNSTDRVKDYIKSLEG